MRHDGPPITLCIDCGVIHRICEDQSVQTTINLDTQLTAGFACMACGHPLLPNGSCLTCNPSPRLAS